MNITFYNSLLAVSAFQLHLWHRENAPDNVQGSNPSWLCRCLADSLAPLGAHGDLGRWFGMWVSDVSPNPSLTTPAMVAKDQR